jgi:predicted NUDIX family NTP pyrophosphohydrolase
VVFTIKMPRISAGLLMYKIIEGELKVFIVHPGGPFWTNKDEGAWSIPKGEVNQGEDLMVAAKREMQEETGVVAKEPFIFLGDTKLRSGKIIHAWAFEGDWSGLLQSNYMKIEWPLHSNKIISIPEVDKAGFYSITEAKKKLNPAQFVFVERLKEHLESI